MRTELACLVILMVIPSAKAADLREKYVGQSGCATELNSPLGHYGIRLDKNRRTRLEAHVFKSETILTIVQYGGEADHCGIVRDVIRSPRTESSFVWECVDKTDPQAVVVGTWSVEHPSVSGPAVKAWRINLNKLRFILLNVPVACNAGNYAGSDDDTDLVTFAQRRARK